MPSSRATIPRLKSIKIKEHLDTLAESNAVSIDIGGTLAKVIIMDNFIENFRCFKNLFSSLINIFILLSFLFFYQESEQTCIFFVSKLTISMNVEVS